MAHRIISMDERDEFEARQALLARQEQYVSLRRFGLAFAIRRRASGISPFGAKFGFW